MILDNIAIGADPELFIINKYTGKVISAVGLIPGDKDTPYKSKDMPKGFGLQVDNILAEFNIPPAKTSIEFINNIQYMKDYINKFIENINPELGILCSASQIIDEDQLQSPEAKMFGCSVDYNVYTEAPNPKPEGTLTNIRSGGFHLHISYKHPNIQTSLDLIKYFDMFLGIPSILIDSDTKRRSLYGKAGCFRLKPYGFEYRVLSSYMMNDIKTLQFIWDQCIRALEAYTRGTSFINPDIVQHIINESDTKLANQCINKYQLCVELPEL